MTLRMHSSQWLLSTHWHSIVLFSVIETRTMSLIVPSRDNTKAQVSEALRNLSILLHCSFSAVIHTVKALHRREHSNKDEDEVKETTIILKGKRMMQGHFKMNVY